MTILRIEHGFFFKEFKEKEVKFNENKCLIIGNISKYKGIEDALSVVRILKEKKIKVFLDIIGLAKPDYLNKLVSIINDYEIKDQVMILSKVVSTEFLINKINQSSMLWLPYKKISQSGVSYTSVGLGKPFVGYDVGNFKDFFGTQGAANIVEKNNVEAFSEAVIEVMTNKELYSENIKKLSLKSLWDSNKIMVN